MSVIVFAALAQAAEPAKKAPAPKDELKRLTLELEKNPKDDALRESLIKVAISIKPAPATPDEATKLAGKASYAFKAAKTPPDFSLAADAYDKASLAAPWVPDYYFNRGVALEKAERFTEAAASFKFYLLASPKAADRKAVLERLGGIEFQLEKAGKDAQAQAAQEQKKREAEEVVGRFRGYAGGRSYGRKLCVSQMIEKGDGSSKAEGCTADQYKGSYWKGWGDGPVNEFYFPGDGTIIFRFIGATVPDARGTPQGPNFADIKWECPKTKWEGSTPIVESWYDGWVDMHSDVSNFTISCDRPNLGWDHPSFNRQAKYMYYWYPRL